MVEYGVRIVRVVRGLRRRRPRRRAAVADLPALRMTAGSEQTSTRGQTPLQTQHSDSAGVGQAQRGKSLDAAEREAARRPDLIAPGHSRGGHAEGIPPRTLVPATGVLSVVLLV